MNSIPKKTPSFSALKKQCKKLGLSKPKKYPGDEKKFIIIVNNKRHIVNKM